MSERNRWDTLEELFHRARGLSPQQRESLFAEHSLDTEQRREIDELLGADNSLERIGESGFLGSLDAVHVERRLQVERHPGHDTQRAETDDGALEGIGVLFAGELDDVARTRDQFKAGNRAGEITVFLSGTMKNDETDPEGIRPVDVTVTLNKDTVRALLRPASVTVVTLRRAR